MGKLQEFCSRFVGLQQGMAESISQSSLEKLRVPAAERRRHWLASEVGWWEAGKLVKLT